MIAGQLDRYVIGRDRNVVRVNFAREPEPPTPSFPGAGALRAGAWRPQPDDACPASLKSFDNDWRRPRKRMTSS
jgi:hypothetical protein